LIFDEQTYSPQWVSNFPIVASQAKGGDETLPLLQTHTTLGSLAPKSNLWRFEPGLGGDVEISETLLLHCGFRLTLANEQTCELVHLEPGLFIGRMPGRATPELFATHQETGIDGAFSFLTQDSLCIGLWTEQIGSEKLIVLCLHHGSSEACRTKLELYSENLQEKLGEVWSREFPKRQKWCSVLPEGFYPENPGLAFERIQGLLEPAAGMFKGLWVRDDRLEIKGMSLELHFQMIAALANFQPDVAEELLATLAQLPCDEQNMWSAAYTLKGPVQNRRPALPCFASILSGLSKDLMAKVQTLGLIETYSKILAQFLESDSESIVPQWSIAETSFTPEVTDPSSLIQFDLAALLVSEIDSLQKITGEASFLEAERKNLESQLWTGFWSGKRKRLLDKTKDGEFAARVTAGTLLPLLWKSGPKSELAALRQCLLNTDELRSPEGIRQWQPKKDDPISPPVVARTQLLFLPLLKKLPAEAAALISADWHRMLEADPEFSAPETAILWTRLLSYAHTINPHLERYPAWVRGMEKYRKVIVTVAAAILLLIPMAFSLSFAFRDDFSQKEELLEAGHAETLITMGNLKEAEVVYTALIERSRMASRVSTYYMTRGNLRFKQERYEEALQDYQTAIERDPIGNLYKARWNLGQVYARLGQTEEANSALQAFIDEYGEELPSFKIRAQHARTLWRK